MIEAYEIGISLALQDGVSAGIALIRRDLETLDRAIAATSQHLTQLQTQAGRPSVVVGKTPNLMPASKPAPVVAASNPAPDTPSAGAPVFAAAAADSALPLTNSHRAATPAGTAIPTQPTPVTPTTGRAAPASPDALAERRSETSQTPPRAQEAKVEGGQQTPLPRSQMPVVRQRAEPNESTALPNPGPPGPVRTGLRPATSPLAPTVDQRRIRGEPNAALLSDSPERVLRPLLTPHAGPAPPALHSRAHAAAPDVARQSPVIMPWFAPSAPPAFTQVAASPSPASAALPPRTTVAAPAKSYVQSAAPQPSTSFAPPPAQSQPTITLSGDVILDGARVGRWMTSTLARQAARPPAGPTGPDPRQTPLWSGQAQGF